ncbi:trypsin-like serine protease [Actinoplanes bogorensis]|uniref:Trypsin-like serine protease n=1 Tax=Paractinoplanes bogorensis TaxID=1610840 RepID=A0ABS5Z5Z5_9ACTN|nr:trypsin-like serine protease [Actinoplanes bogorensis]MBU2670981.1 trypsin-like serine protease [Actinoplanes bogorensis]
MKSRLIAFGVAAAVTTGLWASPAQAIVGGDSPVVDGVDPLPSIVKIYSVRGFFDDGENCTGTLVSQTWVLTAAHCLAKSDDGVSDGYLAKEVKISFRKGPGNSAFSVRPDQIVIMPGYSGTSSAENDVALLHLRSPIKDVPPMPILSGSLFSSVSQVERWGFGTTSPTGGGDPTRNVRRSVEVRNDASDSLLVTDSVRGGGAHGDSGGAVLFRFPSGSYGLVGVTMGSWNRLGGNDDDPAAPGWQGLANRVDTASLAWSFVTTHVADTLIIS